jgi:uncharacterized pyridoxamine 5'-phosphate oxidase family protein
MFDLQTCIHFANENKTCYLATMEGDQPRVRGLMFWFADETGFYFQSGAIKSFVPQLRINPKTEVCFYKPSITAGTSLRITGTVEFVDTPELRERVFIDRPYLKDLKLNTDSPGLVMFRIPHGEAQFWTYETNLQPKQILTF